MQKNTCQHAAPFPDEGLAVQRRNLVVEVAVGLGQINRVQEDVAVCVESLALRCIPRQDRCR